MIGLSNKPTDFLYQSAHHTVVPGKGEVRVGRTGNERGDRCRAERLDKEMKETDEKGKDGRLDFFGANSGILRFFSRKLQGKRTGQKAFSHRTVILLFLRDGCLINGHHN